MCETYVTLSILPNWEEELHPHSIQDFDTLILCYEFSDSICDMPDNFNGFVF